VLHDLRLPHDEDRLAELRGTRRQGGLARRRFLAAVAEHELAPPPMTDRLTAEIEV